jgi:hypothetical protein
MNISKEQAAALGRKRLQPTKEPGDLLCVSVEGKLVNPLNGSQWGKTAYARIRYRQGWHDRIATALLEVGWRRHGSRHVQAHIPKAITITAMTHNRMDRDGLYAAMKPCVDALVICGVIDTDAETESGHVIVIEQKIDRQRRGVEIRVRLKERAVVFRKETSV